MLMVMFILENGKMIRLMVRVCTFIKMALNMRESGRMISSMDMERRFGQMVQPLKEITLKERSKDRGISNGLMEVHTKENSMTTIFAEMVHTGGLMAES